MIDVELRKRGVYLGRAGEVGRERVWIDITAWEEEYGEAEGLMVYRNPRGKIIPMETVRVEETDDEDRTVVKLYGTVGEPETAVAGVGNIEVQLLYGGVAQKSDSFNTVVAPAMNTGKDLEEKTPRWVWKFIEDLKAARIFLDIVDDIEAEILGYRDAAAEQMRTSEAWANGTRDGEPIEEEDVAYNRFSRFWAKWAQAWANGKDGNTDVPASHAAYQNNAKHYSREAEAWAVGQRGGTDVDPEDEHSENNARWYAEQAGDSAEAAADSAEDAEAWAVGQRNGTDVPQGDPNHHNNAKYWSDHAFRTTPEGYEDLVDHVEDLDDANMRMAHVADASPGADLNVTDPAGNVLARFADGHVETMRFNSHLAANTMDADNEGADLNVTDQRGNVLARFVNGHVETKRFKSHMAANTMSAADNGADLDIADPEGNVLARFMNGHLEMKKFRSNYAAATVPAIGEEADLDITDGSGNVILRLKDGHIKTGRFDSALAGRDWRGKKWCCVGDSLTEKNIRSDLVYHDYVSAHTGITVANLGHSGAGYYYRGYSSGIRDQVGRVPLDSDVVTIFGSGNDCYGDSAPLGDVTDTGETTVCGCMNKALSILHTRFPAVNLGIVTPTPWYLQSGSRDWSPMNPGNIMEQYCEALAEICRRHSIPCLDLYHMSNLRPYEAGIRELLYSKDEGNGVHPNEQGHALIAARFQAFLDTLLLH